VARGLAENKSEARAMIMAGEVTVAGKVITKPGSLVKEDANLDVAEKLPEVSIYVSQTLVFANRPDF